MLAEDDRREKITDLKCRQKTTEDRIQLAKVLAEEDLLKCRQKRTEERRQLAKVSAKDNRKYNTTG